MDKKERTKELVEYLKSIKDDEGYAVVDVNAADESTLFDPVGMDRRELAPAVYEHIETRTGVVPDNVPVRVRFHGVEDEAEHERIRAAMRRHYTLKALEVSKSLASNFGKMLFLALFGAAVLAVYFYLTVTSKNVLFTEILSIVGTFSLWEAVNAFLLERPGLRRELLHVKRHIDQRVDFVPAVPPKNVPSPEELPADKELL